MNAKNKTMLYIPLSLLLIIVACSLILMMSSCASQATSNAGAGEVPEAAPANVSTPTQEVQSVADTESETAAEQSEQSQSDEVAAPIQIATIGESCKQQPYVKYEKQARQYIQHGWEATKAQRFGVGFRDAAEYEKWKDVHGKLFTKVSDICEQLSNCVKENPMDKDQKCASEAKRLEQWQGLAKRFVDKVKIVESSQPPMLCSLTPSADEPSQCYALLADRIEQTCQSPSCATIAGCFRGVYFLDDAINQAKLACGFVGQDLSQCRGYIEETARRKAEVEQCLDKYNQMQVEILPVI